MNFSFQRSDFPDDFSFGVATSAYQIEGHGYGGAGPTHWDSFAATPGNVVRAEDGRRACDHYHRYEEDLDLIKAAGLDSYRFSTSWARIMPDGKTVKDEGLDFYDRLVDATCTRGLKPLATLYHWEMPQPLADIGGWRNREIPLRFADLSRKVVERIGDRLHSVAPINEPWCVAWLSHFLGHHAPGLRDIRAAARAMHHVGLAHGLSIAAMRAAGQGNLGAVCNFEYAHPATDSDADKAAATLYDGIYNRWFLGGMIHGQYPEDVLAGLEPHLPEAWQDDMTTIQAPIDWLGLNYYTCKRIAAADTPWPAHVELDIGPLPRTQMGWEIYPEGLEHFLKWVARNYTGDLPLWVTENGMAAPHTGEGDTDRIAYIDAHVQAARQAMGAGVPLKGYVIWSLLDNYEWALGYEKRFGLVHVDFDTLERTPKASHRALAAALRRPD